MNITPELDRQIAENIRNSSAWAKAGAISAAARENVARTNAAIQAVSEIRVPQAVLDDVAKQARVGKSIVAQTKEALAKLDAANKAVNEIKIN